MAVTASIIKNTLFQSVIKVQGSNGSATVNLAGLIDSREVISGTPTVNIAFAQWTISGGSSDTITITRGGTVVLNLFQNSGELDFSGNGGFSDPTGNTDNFTFQITGTGTLYLTVRKVAGYITKPVV